MLGVVLVVSKKREHSHLEIAEANRAEWLGNHGPSTHIRKFWNFSLCDWMSRLRARLNGKTHLLRTCCRFKEIKSKLFTIFPDCFYYYGKLLCKLPDFFNKLFNALYEPCIQHFLIQELWAKRGNIWVNCFLFFKSTSTCNGFWKRTWGICF